MASTAHHRFDRERSVMSLAVDLEFQRLAHRAHRVEQVLVALRLRRAEHAREAVPPGLDRAIHDFSKQLRQMRARLKSAPSAADRPPVSYGR